MLKEMPVTMERTETMAVRICATRVFLFNMFITVVTREYASIANDMQADARFNRVKFIVEMRYTLRETATMVMMALMVKMEQTVPMVRTVQIGKMELYKKMVKTALTVQLTLVKKCHMMFTEIAEKKDEYNKLYEQFG